MHVVDHGYYLLRGAGGTSILPRLFSKLDFYIDLDHLTSFDPNFLVKQHITYSSSIFHTMLGTKT